MNPSRDDIEIVRGATIGREWITQRKAFVYDPAVHNDVADQKRTHAENLDYYGFTYEYIDFATDYASAELLVYRPYRNTSDKSSAREPILTLTSAAGQLILGTRSVTLALTDEESEAIDFDKGDYKLKLHTAGGDVDILVFGDFKIKGDK